MVDATDSKKFFISLHFEIGLMNKKYFYIIILLGFFYSMSVSAQEGKSQAKIQETNAIEGLNLYPNPASNGKVYITSKNDLDKSIIIFDVLGKKVLQTTLTAKELNISNLSPGVYIIKVDEEQATATRKLIIR